MGSQQKGERFKFFKETISELKKVSWPSREEATRLSTMVIVISVVVGFFLGAVDQIFTWLARIVMFRG
ncbi:MAG: preprotein translocase subunit SecE [Chloroflexi bacterium]|nr:preprotein translocase subunit SecE [Chloroflexota bacterium]